MCFLDMFKQWWRPIGVTIFILSIFSRYIGYTDSHLPEAVEITILEIMKWFIGLYVGGRSAEKVTKELGKFLAKQTKSS